MAKFLDNVGLSYFFGKLEVYIKSKYVSIGDIIKIGTSTINKDSIAVGGTTEISANEITSPKFVKAGGTSVQVLLADGSVTTLNSANGIPQLDASGRIPLEQLGNLDTSLWILVSSLPTSNIKSNKIYLFKSNESEGKNIYAEYIYTGNTEAAYDASKWEKLGEYKADVDLSPYSKKSETISIIKVSCSEDAVNILTTMADNKNGSVAIPTATSDKAGVMSPSDKSKLNGIATKATADSAISTDYIDTLFN